MLKNRYKDEYTNTSYVDANGRVRKSTIYNGNFYVLPVTEQQKKRYAWVNLLFALLTAGAFALGGCINPDSSRTAWIVFPYLCMFLPIGYLFIGAVSFFDAHLRMERAAYEGSLLRIMRSCRGILIMTALSALLDVLFIILYHGRIQLGKELLYLVSHLLIGGIVIGYGILYDRMYGQIVEEKNR